MPFYNVRDTALQLSKMTGIVFEVKDGGIECYASFTLMQRAAIGRILCSAGTYMELYDPAELNIPQEMRYRLESGNLTPQVAQNIAQMAMEEEGRRARLEEARNIIRKKTGTHFAYDAPTGVLIADDVISAIANPASIGLNTPPVSRRQKIQGARLYQLVQQGAITYNSEGMLDGKIGNIQAGMQSVNGKTVIFDVNIDRLRDATISDKVADEIIQRNMKAKLRTISRINPDDGFSLS